MRGKILATLRAKPVAIWFSEKKAISPRSNGRGHGCLSHFISSLFAIVLLLAPAAVRANSVWDAVEAGRLTWTNATTNWLASGDLVITYQTGEGTLHLPGFARVWALAVGGGGAGGDCSGTNLSKAGAGGGGGAGGFVETNNLLFAGGDYAITVGAGGAQHSKSATSATVSEPGLPSSIAGIMTAAGGGGGGFKSNGGDGGSGGGGGPSSATSARLAGRAVPPGQGFDGGAGVAAVRVAAGGGGAGGEGAPSSTGTPGNGGLAKPSSITGEEIWYAGGGGGGSALGAGGLGGGTPEEPKKGGGGNGGYAKTSLPMPGTDGLGGGGGGAGIDASDATSPYAIGAKGGDGVVIVRISFVVDGAIEKPKGITALYTGEEIVAGQSIPGVYEVSDEFAATNVKDGPYTYVATLADGLYWGSDPADKSPVSVDWWIMPATNGIPKPAFGEVTYDGENHIAAALPPEPKFKFVEGSVTAATNAGTYSYTAELLDKANWRWSDGSVTNQTFSWTILPRQIAPQPLPADLVYSGTNNVAATNNPNYAFVDGSVTAATNAGTYKVVFQLTDSANNRWADGSVTNLTYFWTIARLPVDYPAPRGTPGEPDWNFIYNGTTQVAATNSPCYSFGGTTTSARNRGDYYFTATPNDNWCWKEGDPLAPHAQAWWIVQAKNEITSLTLGDWKLGEPPKTPSITAKFGANTVEYTYGKSPNGPWDAAVPDTNGVFYVRAYVPEEPEHRDWSSAVRTKRFLIYKSFDELFTDYVDIDFSGYEGPGIEDYRVLVKISPTAFPGFSYARCSDGEGLAFMNMTPGMDESPLAFDVDTWNPAGDSFVWVKLPRLETREGYASTRIRMYWHLREGMAGPGSDAAETWDGYAGVWHFSETIDAAAAPTAQSADATGHGYDAKPQATGAGNLAQMISTQGKVGNARVNATTSVSSGGNRLTVDSFAGCALGTNFVFTGWVKFDSYTAGKAPWILARKSSAADGGFAMALDAGNRKKLDLWGRGAEKTVSGEIAGQDLNNDWVHLVWAVSGDRYWLSARSPQLGSFEDEGTLASPVGEDLAQLAFGSDVSGTEPSVNGKFDEFRLQPWDGKSSSLTALTNAFAATYANALKPTEFVTHGWVVVDGVKQNYWKTAPGLTKNSWEESAPPEQRGQVILGEPAIGTVVYVCARQFDGGQVLTNELPTAAGRYTITFTVEAEGFNTLEAQTDFTILGHSDYPSVGATEEGRILLANDDSRGDWGDTSVTNQAYWLASPTIEHNYSNIVSIVTNYLPGTHYILSIVTNWFEWVEITTNATYWTHSGESTHSELYRPYLLPNSVHTLQTTNVVASLCGGSRLWHLNQIRIGSPYTQDLVDSSTRNRLPWSNTSCAISAEGAVFSKKEIGNIMFRNTTEAAIYSPCYTNGIGTIYFDAVNFKTDDDPSHCRLIVEVATAVTNELGEVIVDAQGNKLLPTDFNVQDISVVTNEVWSEDGESCVTNIAVYTNADFYARAKWEPRQAAAVKFIGNSSVTIGAPGETIELGIAEGNSHENFYRIHVPVNIREPARFRIRRISVVPGHDSEDGRDGYGQILLDNLIVSKPPMLANMESYGRLDLAKTGPSVIGMECATTVPYPAITDTDIRGRARPIYSTTGETGVDTNSFVTGVSFHYRWRYLNQNPGGAGDWREPIGMRRMGDRIVTERPLELPAAEGDVEYWYETFLQTPYYTYVDYSGTDHKLNGPDGKPYYTEEISVVTNRFADSPAYAALGGAPLPSLGNEWFFRLRNGRDTAGSATLVVTEGALAGEYPMYLAEDNTWRCLLAVPAEKSGVCRFYFRVNDRQQPGATEVVRNEETLSPEGDVADFPVKGKLEPGAVPRSFAIDHAATHLEFRFNDVYATYAVTRAEYQTFNEWNDAKSAENPSTKKADFFASYVETNGVNVVEMEQSSAPVTNWVTYVSEDANWNETFYRPNYNDPDYPKEVIFPSHATPNYWEGTYITFVSELLGGTLAKDGKEYLPYPAASGMAGKLLGQGKGRLLYSQSKVSPPDGLERLTFKARIGQSIEFDDFSYSMPATAVRTKNYTFTALASMSHLVTDNNKECDMAAGGALSLIAYYDPKRGCYELRVERIEQGTRVMMSLWKWHDQNGTLAPTCLVKRRMDTRQLWTNDSKEPTGLKVDEANNRNPQYRLMFISVETAADGTKVHGGLSVDAQLPCAKDTSGLAVERSFNRMANGYYGVYYEDASGFKYGSYGLGAKDCPADFLLPRRADTPVQNITLVAKKTDDYEFLVGRTDPKARWFQQSENEGKDLGIDDLDYGDVDDIRGDEYGSLWALTPKRIEFYTNTWITSGNFGKYHQGLRMPQDLTQVLKVEVAAKGDSSLGRWKPVGEGEIEVSGYGFTSYDLPLYGKDQYEVRFTTGDQAIDVVVDDIRQTQWMGHDVEGNLTDVEKFIYTKGHVVTNAAAQRKEIELVPARARSDKALSVRSPVLKGLGKITFTYAGAHTNAELWVQMATNRVDGNLGSYNDSVKSVEPGGQQAIGEWLTLKKFAYASADPELALGASGTKTVYVGLHNQKDRPVEGVFRLFVPTNLVLATDAMTSEELDAGGKDHGKISITGVTVWDEPGLDERSWRGWNLRTAGDEQDLEGRMYLADMSTAGGGYGLVCALNNSLNDAIDKATGLPDDERTRTSKPTIWSPTLGSFTNAAGVATQALVGEVTFKARVYGEAVGLAPAKVALYGALNSVGGRWEKLEEFTVDTPYFRNYSWKAGAESYAAIKFVFDSEEATTKEPDRDRVVLDEITICERVQPTLSFVYAWPFRAGLGDDAPVANVGAPEQQPLCGENWGVQTKLALRQLGDEVDLERGLVVTLLYFDSGLAGKLKAADWGYPNWKGRASGEMQLVSVGDPEELVFRSVASSPASVMPPSPNAGTVVQFMLRVKYYDKGGYPYEAALETWTQPAWYHPVDYNRTLGGGGAFAAYTILDSISPGRAWINEVNWNNGSKAVTHTDAKVVDNQFIEVCVPSGVDLTGWMLKAYNLSGVSWDMARFGSSRVRSSKVTGGAVNGYEFFLLESPETNLKGNLRDADGNPAVSDGVWYSDPDISAISGGTLGYANPFAFELVRPSGAVEHTFTIDGTNEWDSVRYDATNLLAVLNAKDRSPKRFYAGRELEKNDHGVKNPGTTFGSSGVVKEKGSGTGEAESGPGSDGTWRHGLDFTPGALNQGQVIPEGWFLPPNGTNTWVYFSVLGEHLRQLIGDSTARTQLVILPQGVSTNVTYTADPWYELATIAVDGVTNAVHRPRTWTYHFTKPEGAGASVSVVAAEGVDARLDDDRFKLKGQRYRNAVLNWLQNWPDKTPDDIRFARMAHLNTFPAVQTMSLIDMYWLDICPFNSEGSTFEAKDPPESEWVFRGGFTDYKPASVVRRRTLCDVTNSIFKVKMFITNEFDCVANPTHAPETLQGIGNERSCDGNYTGGWTSVTFKINGCLDVNMESGRNRGFLPFREFVFNRNSFAPATAGEGTKTEGNVPGTPGAFEAVIELTDPFSRLSTAGMDYGWWRHSSTNRAFFSWQINHTNATPTTVEQLLPQSTYRD